MAARVSGAATGWGLVDGTRYSIRLSSAGRHLALAESEEQLPLGQLARAALAGSTQSLSQ